MRRAGYAILFFIFLLVIVIPGIIVKSCSPLTEKTKPEQEREIEEDKTISLFVNSSKKIAKLPLEEYVKGVVAAEMPASFNKESLKAQSVAARTYVYKRWRKGGGSGCNLHPQADVCDDPTHCQAWNTKGEMLKKWGIFSYYHYFSKISQAVNSTAGVIILYQDNPIDPLYFSTSNGSTENSEDVWENNIPYLRSVASPGEETSPKYFSVEEIDVREVVNKIRQKWPDIVIDPKNPERDWRVLEVSEGGRVKEMQVGGRVIKGTEFRLLFDLNSTDFKWERLGNLIRFSCKGYGHGVGMSQYGANAMANNGFTYVDILKHYYTGVQVKKVF
ncbi:MAG: stage II sporulation protein D [Thermoanaerobacterales bacterium]|nr:stage II sporulation protein D [Thermoanaerobacterales bacterium]